jgi:hypothetical protein
VARANDPKESIIKLIQIIYNGVNISSLIKVAPTKVVNTATILTVS